MDADHRDAPAPVATEERRVAREGEQGVAGVGGDPGVQPTLLARQEHASVGAPVGPEPVARDVGAFWRLRHDLFPAEHDEAARTRVRRAPHGALGHGRSGAEHEVDGVSEAALGVVADGRVSMVVGSHSHIPTADARILPGGTAFQTDAGMCGDYDSVIGMKKEPATMRFVRKLPGERLTPAEGEGTLCAIYAEIADTGLATRVAPVRQGGRLAQAMP